jgi:hypothetical protein
MDHHLPSCPCNHVKDICLYLVEIEIDITFQTMPYCGIAVIH